MWHSYIQILLAQQKQEWLGSPAQAAGSADLIAGTGTHTVGTERRQAHRRAGLSLSTHT
ncbi:hypothetical protein L195_g062883, partial [Trifolium pratense]